MKKVLVFTTITFCSVLSMAGFAPQIECSNLDATVTIDYSAHNVSILVDRHPKLTYQNFSMDDLDVTETLVKGMPQQLRGKTSRTISFKEITLKLKSGANMPDAYNRPSESDGSLNDYFICSRSRVWL